MNEDEAFRWVARHFQVEPKVQFIPPFPRLRFFLRHRFWCEHLVFHPGDLGRVDGWHMIDFGRRQVRHCARCNYAQFR